VFPANVRLDWKVIASTNTLAYLASSPKTKEKYFITLTPLGINLQPYLTFGGEVWSLFLESSPNVCKGIC
jgi:hypothetical protein